MIFRFPEFAESNEFLFHLGKTPLLLHISELGEGWQPAMLESQEEHDFIRLGHQQLMDRQDFFIGGSIYEDNVWDFNEVMKSIEITVQLSQVLSI